MRGRRAERNGRPVGAGTVEVEAGSSGSGSSKVTPPLPRFAGERAGVRGWSSRRSPRASHFPSRALTAPSAASRSSRHTASTSLRSVGVAPTETRMSCRPFTTLGVT